MGGYRIFRPNKLQQAYQEGVPPEINPNIPSHVAKPEDIQRVKTHIETYDLESGYACAHRNQLTYFHDETLQWKDVYNAYVEDLPPETRVLSKNRWREYVRHLFPHLRLHRVESDLCNACYRLDVQLKDPNITTQEADHIRLQQTTHRGKCMTHSYQCQCLEKRNRTVA